MLGSIYLEQKYGWGILFFVNLRICFKEKRGITLKKIMPLFVFVIRVCVYSNFTKLQSLSKWYFKHT